MSETVIDMLERLEREATPGPWAVTEVRYGADGRCTRVVDSFKQPNDVCGENLSPEDAALIAALRTHAPAILKALRAATNIARCAHMDAITSCPACRDTAHTEAALRVALQPLLSEPSR